MRLLPTLATASFLLASSSVAGADTLPKRPEPDYDGRSGGGDPTTAGDVALWVPRVLFFPFYLVSEYLLRIPLGTLVTAAERAKVPSALYDFFAFGPDHSAGFVPVAFLDFGFRPSFGIYTFWDNAGFKGNDLRAHVSTFGPDYLAGSITERIHDRDSRDLTLNLRAIHRPDFIYYGLGPEPRESMRTRYGADRVEGTARAGFYPWRSSSIEASVGGRAQSFRKGNYDGEPTIEDRVAAGSFPTPDGYERGYAAVVSRLQIDVNSRVPQAASGSGLRLEGNAEQGSDAFGSAPSGWLRWGGSVGAAYDLNDHHRVVSLTLNAAFVERQGRQAIPFTELVTLGGAELLPGFRPGRLRGDSAAVATLRYDWPIWVWLDGTIQSAIGNVFGEHLDGAKPGLLRMSHAIGIESRGSRDSTLQLLVGVGTQTFDQGARVDSVRIVIGARDGF